MSNLVEEFAQKQVNKLSENKQYPKFVPGDTIKVGVKIIEGKTERLQYFEGLCIAREGGGLNSNFTVRKVSNGEGVERKFPLYSPRIESIDIVRHGEVRRAKLYYMRDLRGKAARIKGTTAEEVNDNSKLAAKTAGVTKPAPAKEAAPKAEAPVETKVADKKE